MISVPSNKDTFAKYYGFESWEETEYLLKAYGGAQSALERWAVSDGTKRGLLNAWNHPPNGLHRYVFYLGSEPHNLWRSSVPLFVSRVRLDKYKTFKRASCDWAMDSGGFRI